MPRHLGPGGGGGGGGGGEGTQLPRHMGPPGPKIGGDPHACDTGRTVWVDIDRCIIAFTCHKFTINSKCTCKVKVGTRPNDFSI